MFSWEMLWAVAPLVLLVGLIWAVGYNRGRNRANDKITEAATRAGYDAPEAYSRRADAFRRLVKSGPGREDRAAPPPLRR